MKETKEITEEYLKSEFHRWIDDHNGEIPKREDMKVSEGYPCAKTYCDYLGISNRKWNPVLDFVGVVRKRKKTKRHTYKYDNLTQEDFVNIVKDKAKELGRTPKEEDFRGNNSLPSFSCITDKFGVHKWNEVLKLCDVGQTKERYYTKEQGLENLNEYINKIGYIPSYRELKKSHIQPSATWFESHFNGYLNALKEINYTRVYSDEELLLILKQYYDKNGKSPTSKDLKNIDGYPSAMMYYSRFNTKSWNYILQLAGLEINHVQGYTKEYALNKLKEYYEDTGLIPSSTVWKNNNYIPSYDVYNDLFGGFTKACALLDIDFDTYYNNNSMGTICIDNNGDLCRSIVEREITNYLIKHNIKYDKEPSYSEIIENVNYRFDWKIFINDKVYYVEYFGMYKNNSNGFIAKKYIKKTKKKIKLLYKNGFISDCIFIFPKNLKHGLDSIFSQYINLSEQTA